MATEAGRGVAGAFFMRRARYATLVVAAVGLVAAPAQALGAEPSQQRLNRSIKTEPDVRGVMIAPAKSAANVSFKVRYPRVGKGAERALVKLRVWKSKNQSKLFVERRSRARVPRDRVAAYRFKVKGRAARALRRAGGDRAKSARRARQNLITVVAQHARDIDDDPQLDHTRVESASGQALGGSAPNLGGAQGTLTLANSTGENLVFSAGPGICMYDDGNSGSDVSGLNAIAVEPSKQVTVGIQADSNTFHPVGTHLGIGQTPAQAAELFNAEARQFGFEMNAQYAAANATPVAGLRAQLPRFPRLIGGLPGRGNDCADQGSGQASNFVVGADTEDGLHTSGLWSYSGSGTRLRAELDTFGLDQQLTQGGLHPVISIVKGPSPYGPTSECQQIPAVWMSCVYPPDTTAALTELTSLLIPGSHDSGTAQLNDTEGALFSNGCDETNPVERLVPPAIYNLAVAQRLNLRGQLDTGIRYLDIRAGYDTSTNEWRVNHTNFSQSTLGQDFASVAQWAGAHQDREPFILDVTVCDAGNKSHLDELEQAFHATLRLEQTVDDTNFQTYSIDELTVNPPSDVPPASFARLSMQDIYDDFGGDGPASGNVLVVLHEPASGSGGPNDSYDSNWLKNLPGFVKQGASGSGNGVSPPYSDTSKIPMNSYWPNEQAPFQCDGATSANLDVRNYPYTRTPSFENYRELKPLTQTPFMIGQILYTIHSDAISIGRWIGNATAGGCPNSLLEWEDAGMIEAPPNGGFPNAVEIMESWGDDANIVITDDVGAGGYVPAAIGINERRVANAAFPLLRP